MKKFVMMKGLPASGKSSFCREFLKDKTDWIRINNDELQLMMYGQAFVKDKGNELTHIRELLIEDAMWQGKNIIVDNTNLSPKREVEYRELIKKYNAEFNVGKGNGINNLYEFQVKDFTHVSVAECLRRNELRSNSVPTKVILDMHRQFLAKPFTPLEQSRSLPKALIVDIDGTVADISHRGPYEQTKVLNDKPVMHILQLILLYANIGYHIIYITGREEYSRKDTLTWLAQHGFPMYKLYMNKTGENRSSNITKKEIFEQNIAGKYYIEFVLEDRWKNIDAWTQMGLLTLMVGGTENFF